MLRGSAVFAFRGHSAQRSGIRGQVDKKLRSKIEEKKAAHGIKTDGSQYYYDPYDKEQSM